MDAINAGSLVVAAVAALAAVLTAIANRRQARGEAAKAVSDAALNLIEPLNERIGILEGTVARLAAENKKLRKLNEQIPLLLERIEVLENSLRQIGEEKEKLREENQRLRAG